MKNIFVYSILPEGVQWLIINRNVCYTVVCAVTTCSMICVVFPDFLCSLVISLGFSKVQNTDCIDCVVSIIPVFPPMVNNSCSSIDTNKDV